MTTERAPAKLNLVLHVGPPRADGLHPLCSLFASIGLEDELAFEPLPGEAARDEVQCPGVEGPNLIAAALAALRERVGAERLPPQRVTVDKRIPVAAGLGGGSADAAAALRAGNRLAGTPLTPAELRGLAAGLGSDVPSQVEPRHALVQDVGEWVEPVELPPLVAVLAPPPDGLATPDVYRELDRLGKWRDPLDPEPLRALAYGPPEALGAGVENDLQPAALSLRPELSGPLDALTAAGALGAAVSGSGPTCFGLFLDREAAGRAAAGLPGALVAELRG